MTTFGLVVPVFNEAARLREFGEEIVDHLAVLPEGSELVFVDDGSTDDTPKMVEALIGRHPDRAVRLLRRRHAGKGAAVAAGLRSSRAAYRGFCDLDLSTPLDQFELVRHAALRAPVLAIGSRDLPGSRLIKAESALREWLGRSYNRLLQATVAPGLVDTQCGAKVAAGEVWDAVLPHCREDGYAWDAEVIAVARALHIDVQEVPVQWRHDERSKLNVGRDGAAMVWAVPRIWRRARIVGRLRPEVETAPVHQRATEVFDADNAEKLMAADRDHWWFRSKAALVSTALRRTGSASDPTGEWLVDAGAGSGGVTSMLGWRPDRVAVLEGNEVMVRRALQVHGLSGLQSNVGALPVGDGTVAVVCLLDVIEHLDDPLAAVTEAVRVLRPGGRLVITVPAHEWLWSAADEELGHIRRYDRSLLRRQLEEAGVEPEVVSHVFSWLVGPVFATRRLARGGGAELGLDRSSTFIDLVAMVLTRIERGLIGRVSLPVGTSVLGVGRKPLDPTGANPTRPTPGTDTGAARGRR